MDYYILLKRTQSDNKKLDSQFYNIGKGKNHEINRKNQNQEVKKDH